MRRKIEGISTNQHFGIYAVSVCKGGNGKSTLSINVPRALAMMGFKVLVIDLDAQGSSSKGLSLIGDENHILSPVPKIHQSIFGVDVVVGNIDIITAKTEDTEIIRKFCQKFEVAKNYNFVFIDCPSSVANITIAAIKASDKVIVPIKPEKFSITGLTDTVKFVHAIDTMSNKQRGIYIVPNEIDNRRKLASAILGKITKNFGSNLLHSIHRCSSIADSQYYQKPIQDYKPYSRASKEFYYLAKNILKIAGV